MSKLLNHKHIIWFFLNKIRLLHRQWLYETFAATLPAVATVAN